MSDFNAKAIRNPQPAAQSGAALVTSLLILLVMTLIGASGMQSAILEEKMAGNQRDRNLAFQAAETALRAAESALNGAVLPIFNCSAGYIRVNDADCNGSPEAVAPWEAVNWGTQAVAYSGGNLANLAGNPAYIVEEMNTVPESGGSLEANVAAESAYYRITSRGVGGTDTAVVMLQSTFKR